MEGEVTWQSRRLGGRVTGREGDWGVELMREKKGGKLADPSFSS